MGLGLIKLLYPGVKGDEEFGQAGLPGYGVLPRLAMWVMQAQQRINQPCWRYWFDYVAEAEHQTYLHGAWHGNEVPYVFDTLGQITPSSAYATENDLAFAASVADYWVNFARDASASHTVLAGPVRWPAAVRGRDRLLRMGLNKQAGISG
ncbi:Carboxylesterase family [Kluyvera cryocrescens]|uniref:Carboxylesterase family n=1 Tax=Kluyvera cryocrescens TaxID=580 RepID=A0A485CPZ4_KLUCR|nr:Carboxylesterase family [Kluyvera cryocrescens]